MTARKLSASHGRRARRWIAVAAIGTFLLVADLTRAPREQWSVAVALTGIAWYQQTLGPVIEAARVRCRFTPTCSRYAHTVISDFGAAKGSWLVLRRLAKCGPWTPAGTVDQPPEVKTDR